MSMDATKYVDCIRTTHDLCQGEEVGIDIVDAIDYAADETIASGLVDAAIAGIAVLTGVASTLKQEAKEGLFEEASFLGFRNTVGEIFRVISRLR